MHYIECGLIDGVSWIHGLGYQPHVALYEDPVLLRRKMDTLRRAVLAGGRGVSALGQGRPAARRALRDEVDRLGAPRSAARAWTRPTACTRPQGLTDDEAMDLMKRSYEQIIEVAEAHQIIVNIEPHGYFTTKPDMMAEMLAFCDSPYLRMNMDTGNTFIAGQDPVAFLKRFLDQRQPRAREGRLASRWRRPCAASRPASPSATARSATASTPTTSASALPCCATRLQRRAEHGVRGPGRPDDRAVAAMAPRRAGGIEDPRRRAVVPTWRGLRPQPTRRVAGQSFAAKRRQSIARGVSPWRWSHDNWFEPRRGDRVSPPLRGCSRE